MPHRLVRALLGLFLLTGMARPLPAADVERNPAHADAAATHLAAIEADLASLNGEGWKEAIDRLNARGSDDVKTAYQHLFNRRLNLWTGRPVLVVDVGGEQRAVHPCIASLGEDSRPLGEPIAIVPAGAVSAFLVKPLARTEVRKALTLIDLYHPAADKRLAAVKDLGNKRVADALPRLRELMTDGDAVLRREAEVSVGLITAADTALPLAERLAASPKSPRHWQRDSLLDDVPAGRELL